MARVLLSIFLTVAAVVGEQTDAGWEMLVTTSGDATPRTCFDAPKVPSYARGSFFIAGPAKFEIGKYQFGGIFDGFGKENRFEMSEGKVCYTSAWMNTGYKAGMEKLGFPRGVLFEDTTPPRPHCPMMDPICNMEMPADNNWVSMVTVAGEGMRLSDTAMFVREDLDTLNNTGIKAWSDDKKQKIGPAQPSWVHSGHVGATGSAHPRVKPGTTEYIDVIVEQPMVSHMGMVPYLSIYSFDSAHKGPQERKQIASIEMDTTHYFHSYGVTQNYFIFIYDLAMDMLSLFNPFMLGKFKKHWGKIQVFDDKGKLVQAFDTEPFTHVHLVNSYENATGIVLDVPTMDYNPFELGPQLDRKLFLNKTVRDASSSKNGVTRYHLHLAGPLKGQTTKEALYMPVNRFIDFPKVSAAVAGLPYCHYYATEWFHDEKNYASMAILKQDVCNSRKVTYWARDDFYPGEPFFIGGGPSGAEDDGLVVFVALDGRRKMSVFVVLDAKTMEELEVIDLPQHIPFTAHGQFVPAGAAHPLHSSTPQAVVV